ncbi:molybdopterin-dependent oxidoreductase [Rhodovulum euryhalinum]|uniref:Xanthine dehydrogenase molybdenum binding subunit apoprotein n=1 Tax=Rhodovulum euryhalinum TaxID=35805 RepID=A0A4R2KEN7_9RHOB|nr:molybdopterin cofactor-binding domain-containing protein [Rhodovulum euryhalinum]TCO70772.1 xanthine dehydrogenase molybdenum binding subunit apoprotein [Rhodovulum euryhalinum]
MNRPETLATLRVNGAEVRVSSPPGRRLSEVLREELRLQGTKVGCDAGDCGACTVLLDGAPVCACLTPLAQALGRAITTVEGLSAEGLSRLQEAFLRHGAAQCGICTPGMLMAASAVLAVTPRPTRAEAEAALGGVLCRCTGYARILDAVCDVAPGPEPLRPVAGAAVGAAVERLDGRPKVTGAERFGADGAPVDALLVRAVRAPHAAARFAFGDLAGWAAARGVRVLTAADIQGENRFGVIPPFADQPALAEAETRFRGEAVALVVGEAATVAGLDLSAFPVVWHPGAPVTDPAGAAAARPIHAGRPGNLLTAGRVVTGGAAAALAASAHVVEGAVETGFVEHAYIEPEAGWAEIAPDGTLVIHACTQAPVMDRDDTARVLGLPPARVRIVPTAVGGGFGSKLDLSLQPLIGLAALATGRPCRMVYDRAESMMSTTKRHPARLTARIGCDAGGWLTGMEFDGLFDTGAYASWGPTVANRVPVHASGPYRMPAYRAETRAIHTNNPVAGAFRGFGVPQAAILQETLFDRLAEAAGLDPLDFRLRNALRDGDRSVCGQEMRGVGIAQCLTALAPRWRAARAEAAAFNAGSTVVKRGAGLASCWYGCGNTALPNPSTVRLGITREGRLWLHQGATDIGQGSNTVIAQLAADALGVALGDIGLIGPDTALTPDCGKTSASRQTVVTGKAAVLAGRALRAAILARANRGDDAALRFDGGRLVVRDGQGETVLDLGTLPEIAHGYVLLAEETYDPPTAPLDADGQGRPYAVYGYGAQLAEVEVDTELGTVRVIRITAAHDVGRVVNPTLAEGQVQGGIAQGLGLALMEEYLPGRTENLHDYLIPTTGDMPEIETILVEVPDPEGPMGAKGLGEHALIPTAPAILNAIAHATGARITRVPALPHRVLAAVRAAGRGP